MSVDIDGPLVPKFEWGQRVQVIEDVYNDGSYPDQPVDALLAKSGDMGEIVNIGMLEETKRPLYLVEFESTRFVIGCLEEELALA